MHHPLNVNALDVAFTVYDCAYELNRALGKVLSCDTVAAALRDHKSITLPFAATLQLIADAKHAPDVAFTHAYESALRASIALSACSNPSSWSAMSALVTQRQDEDFVAAKVLVTRERPLPQSAKDRETLMVRLQASQPLWGYSLGQAITTSLMDIAHFLLLADDDSLPFIMDRDSLSLIRQLMAFVSSVHVHGQPRTSPETAASLHARISASEVFGARFEEADHTPARALHTHT